MIIAHSRTFYDNLQLLISQTRQDSVKGLFDRYGDILFRALMNPPTIDSNIEVMLQAFGYLKKKLTPGERILSSVPRSLPEGVDLNLRTQEPYCTLDCQRK
jgi:uncharacterized protein YbgA (DUF1722 family)